MLSKVLKLKCSKNRIFVMSHFAFQELSYSCCCCYCNGCGLEGEDAEAGMATCEESSFAVDDPSDWPSYFRELRVRLQIVFSFI